MTRRQNYLFHEKLFREAAEEFSISYSELIRIRQGIDRLKDRFFDGTMRRAGPYEITELRAQQAFNQLVFENILGFSGLLGERLPYSLLPELSIGKSRPDVSIGWFSETSGHIKAVVELKSPGADLETPQHGDQYRSKISSQQLTAIGQVLEAMSRARAEWALATNMREMYLFHASSPDRALYINLINLSNKKIPAFFYAFGIGGFLSINGPSRLDVLRRRAERTMQ